jgi:hypothetical protein
MKMFVFAILIAGFSSISSFANDRFDVENKVEIPQEFMKASTNFPKAQLVSDGVYKKGDLIIIDNPRIVLEEPYKGKDELFFSDINGSNPHLCGLFGLDLWSANNTGNALERKVWGDTPKAERISVVLFEPTRYSIVIDPWARSSSDGVVSKLACKLY